jgi:hypothetical protein
MGMAIRAEVEVARADVNDEYGVSLWQRKKLQDYQPEEARLLASELVRAADQADELERVDRAAAFGGDECVSLEEMRRRLETRAPSGFDRDESNIEKGQK